MTDTLTHEVATDTKIAQAYETWAIANTRAEQAKKSLLDSYNWHSRGNTPSLHSIHSWLLVGNEPTDGPDWQRPVTKALAKYEGLVMAAADAKDAYRAAEEEYEGWSRFFLVTNAGGHIHSSMSCSTCRLTTRFGWLPNLSGLTEADAVKAHGPLLCTVCFPSAPVEWTEGIKRDYCPGSGQYIPANTRNHRNWGHCPVCDKHGRLTPNFAVRKHAPK